MASLWSLSICHSLILWESGKTRSEQKSSKSFKKGNCSWEIEITIKTQVKKDLPQPKFSALFVSSPRRACLLAIKRAASHSHLDVISSIWRHLEQRREPSQRNESSKRLVGGSLLDPKWCQIKHLFFCPTAPFSGLKSSLLYIVYIDLIPLCIQHLFRRK